MGIPQTPLRHNGRETTATTHFRDEHGKPVAETWRFARCTMEILEQFSVWAAQKLPHPLEVATTHLDKLVLKDAEISRKLEEADARHQIDVIEHNRKEHELAQKEGRQPDQRKLRAFVPQAKGYSRTSDFLMDRACDKMCCYLGEGSPEVQSLLRSSVGTAYLFYLLLLEHQPSMTHILAGEIAQNLGQDKVTRVLSVTRGTLQEDDAPKKSEAPAASK